MKRLTRLLSQPLVRQVVDNFGRQPAPIDSLIDKFGRQHSYLRISLTERCNLRCQYCMPEEGVDLTPKDDTLTSDEIVRITKVFHSLGIKKIRLTGGEPLVYPEITQICEEFGKLPGIKTIGITTNGLKLPSKLKGLKAAGMDSVNISLDTLDEEKFKIITRRNGLKKVMQAIDQSAEAGIETKVNCVVMRGVNDEELHEFVGLTKDRNVAVRFIEFMPFDDNRWNDNKFVSYKEMLDHINRYHPLERLSQDPNDTSKYWRVPGYKGTVGFITSMSEHFCGGCNRLRITADGNLKVCLFGRSEISLRDAMRSNATDDELKIIIANAVLRKHEKHGGYKDMHAIAKGKNRAMIKIGG